MIRTSVRWLSVAFAAASLVAPAQAANQTLFGSTFATSRGPSTFYTINQATGGGTLVGALGVSGVGAMDFAPNGTLYGAGYDPVSGDSFLITINTSTGAATRVGASEMGVFDNIQDMSFRPSDGKLFVYSGGTIFTVSLTTGVATPVGFTGNFPSGDGMAFSGNLLYLANTDVNPSGSLFTVNQANGSLTLVSALSFAAGFVGPTPRVDAMKFDASGTLWVSVVTGNRNTANNLSYLGTLNPATGAVAFVAATVQGLDGLAFSPPPPTTSVPALSDGALVVAAIGLALGGIWLLGRRQLVA